jgi:hypothetical protein
MKFKVPFLPLVLIWGNPKEKLIRPSGHSAFAEMMIQPTIFMVSTAMSLVAVYVMAKPEFMRIGTSQFTAEDGMVIILVFILGFVFDMAIMTFSSRFRMHMLRGNKDIGWAIFTFLILAVCVTAESMTLIYFGYTVAYRENPSMLPKFIVGIHDALMFIRSAFPPLLLVTFVIGLLPISIEKVDRYRHTKAITSQNIAALEQELVNVDAEIDPKRRERIIQALADQYALNEHAGEVSEAEINANEEFIKRLRRQGGLPEDERGDYEAKIAAIATEISRLNLGYEESLRVNTTLNDRIKSLEGSLENGKAQTKIIRRLEAELAQTKADLEQALAAANVITHAPPPPLTFTRPETGNPNSGLVTATGDYNPPSIPDSGLRQRVLPTR